MLKHTLHVVRQATCILKFKTLKERTNHQKLLFSMAVYCSALAEVVLTHLQITVTTKETGQKQL